MARASKQLVERRGTNRKLTGDAGVRPTPASPRRKAAATDAVLAFPSAAAIVRHAARAAAATDRNNLVLHWNNAAAELFGWSTDEAVGNNLQVLINARDIHGNRLAGDHGAFHEIVRSGEAPQSFELDVLNSEGQKERVAVSIVVVLGPQPTEYSLVYLMTPLRRRRRADEAIDRLLAETRTSGVPALSGAHRRGTQNQRKLTIRQVEVLQLLAAGHRSSEIAEAMGISIHTVRTHTQAVLNALGVGSRLEAVSKAFNERII